MHSQFKSPKERLILEARTLREEAKLLPPGVVREAAIRAADLADVSAYLDEWTNSPALQPPN